MSETVKQYHLMVSEDKHREVEIMSTYRSVSMKNLIEEAIELYKLKFRLADRVNDFMR